MLTLTVFIYLLPTLKYIFLQIHIDIPRMNPLIPIFQQLLVQEVSYICDHTILAGKMSCDKS